MSGAIKINGTSSGSTTITAPASGGDETIELSTALAAKLDSIASATSFVATDQTTASTTYTDLTTAGPAVTVTTGTKALVIVTGYLYAGNTNSGAYMGFAVSGASTVAADDAYALRAESQLMKVGASAAFLVTGLTAGSNTFTAKYRVFSGSTASFRNRHITVVDLGS